MVSIKTDLWKKKDVSEWKHEYKRLANSMSIIFIINTIYLSGNLDTATEIALLIINIVILSFILIINISYHRYKKDEENRE